MQVKAIQTDQRSIDALNELLMPDGILRPLPAAEIKQFKQADISGWCVQNAIYQVPTVELIDWLKETIGNQKAIEIGAGNGVFGRVLGIPATDSYQQEREDMKQLYAAMKQPVITYGSNVVKLDAEEAVNAYLPDVVLGCWVTQKWKAGYENGNEWGIDEFQLLSKVKQYIVVGNEATHGSKAILGHFKHTTVKADWLITRSMQKNKNIIYIFEGKA